MVRVTLNFKNYLIFESLFHLFKASVDVFSSGARLSHKSSVVLVRGKMRKSKEGKEVGTPIFICFSDLFLAAFEVRLMRKSLYPFSRGSNRRALSDLCF